MQETESTEQTSIEKVDLRHKLLKKLRGGNRLFPHLNATIGRSNSKLDLASLDLVDEGLSQAFLNELMSGKLSFKISVKQINSDILKYTNRAKELKETEDPEIKEELKREKERITQLAAFKKKIE